MRSIPFTALVLACLAVLLAARFALDPLVGPAAAATEPPPSASTEGVMALPPKPEGLAPEADPDGDGEGSSRYTLEGCLAMATDVRDVCLQALARQSAARDPDGALQVCAQVGDAELALECRADVAETAAPVDRAAAERICTGIESLKWRGQCHFGIGLALAGIDADYALGRCEHAEAFKDFCRHDVVGEVSLRDVDHAVAYCAKEEGDTLARRMCWHGIGKYLARRDVGEARAACDRSTLSWRGTCFHGIGWGSAERDPDATLAACAGLPEYADYCRQGVAAELKRFDAARGVAICEGIATADIRERCLAFLQG